MLAKSVRGGGGGEKARKLGGEEARKLGG